MLDSFTRLAALSIISLSSSLIVVSLISLIFQASGYFDQFNFPGG